MDPTDLMNYAAAIRAIESSGNYRSVGPRTKTGDRAYGAYQVMGQNVPEWTKGALGRSMTPQQFLGDKNAQDSVFNKYFGDNVSKYGNPNDAASVWFTGQPQSVGGNRNDGYIDGNEYVKRFAGALAASRGQAPTQEAGDMGDTTELSARERLPQQLPGQPSSAAVGLSGLGGSLQEAGAFLMGQPGAAASLSYANAARRKANQGQLVDMGTDPLTGQKNWGLFDPATQSFKPFNGSGVAGASGSSGVPTASGGDRMDTPTFMANVKKVQSGQMTPEEFTKSMPAEVATFAKALVDGNSDPRIMGNRAGAIRPFAIMAAHVMDPNFNENDISARQAENKNLATSNNPSTLGGAIASLGKVSTHGERVYNASEALSKLQTFSNSTANTVENWLQSKGGEGSQEYKNALQELNAAVDLYSRELDRLTSGGHSSLAGQEALRKKFGAEFTHGERAAALRETLGMGQDATDQLIFNNNRAFGRIGTDKEKTVADFMSPATLKAWKTVQHAEGSSKGAPAETSAVPVTIGDKQYIKRNGQWYPAQ